MHVLAASSRHKFKKLSNHVIPTESLKIWKRSRAVDALAEVEHYDMSYAPPFICLCAQCGDNTFLKRAENLLAEREPNASQIFHCLEAFVDQRDAIGGAATTTHCGNLTKILRDRDLIPNFDDWRPKDFKRIAKIGRVLGESWSARVLSSLPLQALTAELIMSFLEEAGKRLWWTRSALLKIFRVKLLGPVIQTASHIRRKKGYNHELEDQKQLTRLLNTLRGLNLEQDAEMLQSCMSCW